MRTRAQGQTEGEKNIVKDFHSVKNDSNIFKIL